jgi:hypothetical protein
LGAACDELFDIGKLHELDRAGNDQLGTADVEVIAAAAAQIRHLEAGRVLASQHCASAGASACVLAATIHHGSLRVLTNCSFSR